MKVILFTARPGVIIGRKGSEVERIQEELQTLTGRRIDIKIEEIARPEIDAQLISEDIAEQLKKRSSFRRTIKRALEQTMDGGAKGVKVQLSGRLGGSEMSRTEGANLGSIPLSTLRAKIDYGFSEAKTAQGHIGIKVWVNQGDYLKADESMEGAAPEASSPSASAAVPVVAVGAVAVVAAVVDRVVNHASRKRFRILVQVEGEGCRDGHDAQAGQVPESPERPHPRQRHPGQLRRLRRVRPPGARARQGQRPDHRGGPDRRRAVDQVRAASCSSASSRTRA